MQRDLYCLLQAGFFQVSYEIPLAMMSSKDQFIHIKRLNLNNSQFGDSVKMYKITNNVINQKKVKGDKKSSKTIIYHS